MSAPVPKDFDAENADNLEDVRLSFLPFLLALLRVWLVLPSVSTNEQQIEKQFAVKAVRHLETYWAILEKVKGSSLRLTKMDDDIYEHLRAEFPDFDPAATINEDEMKSKVGKERWRKFMMAYDKKVDDYNFGTMLRTSPKVEYGQDTTIFVPRMQFYAIEIARNKAGLNDWIYEKAHGANKS
ncbi:ATP-dependent permease [Hypoxylon texense]